MEHYPQEGFSANVRIRLEVEGRTIPLAETGSIPRKAGMGYAVPCEPQEIPVGTAATLIVHIDDRELRWGVVLEHGAVPFDERFRYRIKEYPSQPSLFQVSQ